MQWAEDFINWLRQEARELRTVWGTFAVAVIIVMTATWVAVDRIYDERVKAVEASNQMLRDQLASLTDSREQYLSAPAFQNESTVSRTQRHFTDDGLQAFRRAIYRSDAEKEEWFTLVVAPACGDCPAFAEEIRRVAKGMNIAVYDDIPLGPSRGPPDGIVVRGQECDTGEHLASRLMRGFVAAGFNPTCDQNSDTSVWLTAVEK